MILRDPAWLFGVVVRLVSMISSLNRQLSRKLIFFQVSICWYMHRGVMCWRQLVAICGLRVANSSSHVMIYHPTLSLSSSCEIVRIVDCQRYCYLTALWYVMSLCWLRWNGGLTLYGHDESFIHLNYLVTFVGFLSCGLFYLSTCLRIAQLCFSFS